MMFDYIDKAYYINLDYRTDRKLLLEERIKEIGLDIERYEAVKFNLDEMENPYNDKDWHKKMACNQSHINIIKLAKKQKLKNVWILEDDCVFVDGFVEKAKKCIDELQLIDWDILYFGGEPNRQSEPHSDLLVKTNGAYGIHSYIINNTFYDKVINNTPTNLLLDVFLLNFDESDKIFYISKELLCLQDGNFESDLWGGKINRDQIYGEAYKKYIK